LSVYSSLCRDHEDKFDVAFSCVEDEVRVIIWKCEDTGNQAEMYLTGDEAYHFACKLIEATGKARR